MKAVFFVGLSGVGKSALMRALTTQFPNRFTMPQRWTTRRPKTGDLSDEVQCISEHAFDQLTVEDQLLFEMQQNALSQNSTRSGYPKKVLDQPKVSLLFCSVFSLKHVQHLRSNHPHVLCVHIRAPWRQGLEIRGGESASSRAELNETLAHLFTDEALRGQVDFHYKHQFEGAKPCCLQLAARISEHFAQITSSTTSPAQSPKYTLKVGQTLSEVGLYWMSGNVRLAHRSLGFPIADAQLRSGVAHRGDLVFGRLRATPQKPLKVWDWRRAEITLHHPAFVIAPAGDRESSTHVNGGVPAEGLPTHMSEAPLCHWLAGESGLVGLLESEGVHANDLSEKSSQLEALAHLVFPDDHPRAGQPINVSDLAIRPVAQTLTKPLIAIGATSAEAGKTTLIERLVRHLSSSLKIGVIKGTGTGGTVDSRRHKSAGAHVTFDQVDSGCVTTYIPSAHFTPHIPPALLACEDAGVDLMIVELGGDLPWANNSAYLNHPLVKRHLRHLFVICNDALAYYGAHHWVKTVCSYLEPQQVSMITSPFRNPKGFQDRRRVLGGPPLIAYADLGSIVSPITQLIDKGSQPRSGLSAGVTPIDASAGHLSILDDFWRHEAIERGLSSSHFETVFEEMSFHLEGPDCATDIPLVSPLEAHLRTLHTLCKNADVTSHHLVLGNGSRQLLLAAIYALRKQAGSSLFVDSKAPFYPAYGRICSVNPSLGQWVGSELDWTGGLTIEPSSKSDQPIADRDTLSIHCIPNNPDGFSPSKEELERLDDSSCILDLSYYWPHFLGAGQCALLGHKILLFSLSKLTGHGGLRFGWSWVKDEKVAQDMREYIRHHSIGVSRAVLRRVDHIFDLLLESQARLLFKQEAFVKNMIQERYQQIEERLQVIGWSRYIESRSQWCYVWLRDPVEQIRTHLSLHGIQTYPGEKMGKPGYLRLNILISSNDFTQLLNVLERARS